MTSHPAHPVRGLALFLAALFLFASADVMAKSLMASYAVPLVVAVRYAVSLVLLVALLGPGHGRALARTRRTGLVLVRGGALVVASLFMGLALQRMPVAEATAIVFLSPALVVLASGPWLGERVGPLAWAAAGMGLAGVLLIARPGAGLDAVGVACALVAVAATVAYVLLSRVLAATESTPALLFWAMLAGTACFGATVPWSWGGPAPTPLQLALFVGLGASAGLGHYLFTAAFRHAEASLLAPLNYLRLVWAGLLGWAVFRHVPDGPTILGMGVVAGSGALVALRSRAA